MHLGARDFVHAELIDPRPATPVRSGTAAAASSCSRTSATAPRRSSASAPATTSRCVPSPCACGRTSPRMRCVGRTDDMLIVRGVNVFPSAVREVVAGFAPGQRPHRRAPGRPGEAGSAASRARRARGGGSRRRGACGGDPCETRATLIVSTRVDLAPWGSLQRKRVQVDAPRPEGLMKKLQTQACTHHDRRRRPADVDRLLGGPPRHAVRVRAAEPRQRGREPPLLRPGRRSARSPSSRTRSACPSRAGVEGAGQRPAPRVRAVAGDLPPGSRAPRRARSSTPGVRTAASWTRSTSTTRSVCSSSSRRTGSSRRSDARTPTSCSRRITARSATTTSTGSTSRTRSRRRPALALLALARSHTEEPLSHVREDHMANTLSILKPSVNNLTTRIFVRAAGLEFDEGRLGRSRRRSSSPRARPTSRRSSRRRLPRGALWESCAIMQYLCNRHGLDRFYPTDPGERAMVDSAMFYLDRDDLSADRARDVSGSTSRSTPARSRPPRPTTG